MAKRFRNSLGQRIRFPDGRRLKDEDCCCEACSGDSCNVPTTLFLDLNSFSHAIHPALGNFQIGAMSHAMTYYGGGIFNTPGGYQMQTNHGACKFFGPEVGTTCNFRPGGIPYNAAIRAYAARFGNLWNAGYAFLSQDFQGVNKWAAFQEGIRHELQDTGTGGTGPCAFHDHELQYSGDTFAHFASSCNDGSTIGQCTVTYAAKLIRLYQ